MLVLDMSGFSRATRRYGIVEYLLVIRRVRALMTPLVAKRGGDVVKAEADNLFCLFRSVDEAAEERVVSLSGSELRHFALVS